MKPHADASLGKQRCRPRTTRNRHARSAARSSRPRRTRWSCTPLLDRLTSMRPARRQRRCCAHRRRACRGRAAPIEAATGPCQTSKTRARGPIWAWSAARTPPTEAAWTATFLFRSVGCRLPPQQEPSPGPPIGGVGGVCDVRVTVTYSPGVAIGPHVQQNPTAHDTSGVSCCALLPAAPHSPSSALASTLSPQRSGTKWSSCVAAAATSNSPRCSASSSRNAWRG
jgi:hypothetical protein